MRSQSEARVTSASMPVERRPFASISATVAASRRALDAD
jgi:hypothetical protein